MRKEMINTWATPRQDDIKPAHGLFCLPNAQSFENTHLSTPLVTYAQGWRDQEDYDAILEFLFPAGGKRYKVYREFKRNKKNKTTQRASLSEILPDGSEIGIASGPEIVNATTARLARAALKKLTGGDLPDAAAWRAWLAAVARGG